MEEVRGSIPLSSTRFHVDFSTIPETLRRAKNPQGAKAWCAVLCCPGSWWTCWLRLVGDTFGTVYVYKMFLACTDGVGHDLGTPSDRYRGQCRGSLGHLLMYKGSRDSDPMTRPRDVVGQRLRTAANQLGRRRSPTCPSAPRIWTGHESRTTPDLTCRLRTGWMLVAVVDMSGKPSWCVLGARLVVRSCSVLGH